MKVVSLSTFKQNGLYFWVEIDKTSLGKYVLFLQVLDTFMKQLLISASKL